MGIKNSAIQIRKAKRYQCIEFKITFGQILKFGKSYRKFDQNNRKAP
jgi:hypothetical protein